MVVGVTCTGVDVRRRAAWDGRASSSDRAAFVNPHRPNATLHTLELEGNQIGDVGAAAIVEGLRCVPTYRAIS